MRFLTTVSLLLLVVVSSSFGQKKKWDQSLTQYWGKKHKPMVYGSNKKMAKICPVAEYSEYPYQGIGIRVGDSFGLTYKLYISKSFAFALDGGIASYGLYKSRYRQLFNTLPESDTLNYFSHQVQQDIQFSAKVSYYREGPNFLKGLDWYVSLGWQFRFADIQYGYNYEVNLFEEQFGSFVKEMNYMGPEAFIGIEYKYLKLPMAAFMEVGAFYDVVYQPTFIMFQFGVGLMYVF